MYYQDRDKESAERWLNINEEDVSIDVTASISGFNLSEFWSGDVGGSQLRASRRRVIKRWSCGRRVLLAEGARH